MIKHIGALDGIRGLAILAVIATHVIPTRGGGGLWIGVDLFFVLSGFLITSILLREWDTHGSVSFRRFYIRRALRLYPALIACVLFAAVFAQIMSGSVVLYMRDAALSVTYLMDFAQAGWPELGGGLSHTWSLSVEEHFYLVWPPILIWTLKRGVDPRWVALIGILLALVFLWIHRLAEPGNIPSGYCWPQARALEPLLGCLLALGLRAHGGTLPGPVRGAPVAWAGLVGLAVVAALGDRYSRNDYLFPEVVAAGLASMFLVAGVTADEKSWLARRLAMRPLREAGKISYGWYLYHYPVFMILDHYVANGGFRFALAISGSLLLAALSYRFIEEPFLRRKDRYSRGPRRTMIDGCVDLGAVTAKSKQSE